MHGAIAFRAAPRREVRQRASRAAPLLARQLLY
jgi:hypothetical protein